MLVICVTHATCHSGDDLIKNRSVLEKCCDHVRRFVQDTASRSGIPKDEIRYTAPSNADLSSEQKITGSQQVMSNQRSNAQRLLSTPSDEVQRLQSEMARLTAHIALLTAQQQAPAPRNLMRPTQPLVHIQNAGDRPLGAHLQMSSFHGCCTLNDASCRAQCPNSASPSNAATTHTSCCDFC
uniref:Uncharacterized protein n=1 Tax=Romanomermis culicivorax TaxID=13658 RepID=A0A915IP26_ROMCU